MDWKGEAGARVRLAALEMAVEITGPSTADPDIVLEAARKFYSFVRGTPVAKAGDVTWLNPEQFELATKRPEPANG